MFNKNMEIFVIIILGLFIIFCYNQINTVKEYLKHDITDFNYGGKNFKVQKFRNKEEAAKLLDKLCTKLENFIDRIYKKYPNDPRCKRMKERFDRNNILEGRPTSEDTSYSINKGETIVFCIRSKEDPNEIHDLNLILFVALHEMAHLASISVGHNDEFWTNFRFILREAIKMDIYTYIDFKNEPRKYCGLVVDSSPI